jgi:UDP-N-acetyl-D-mannosaminuronic acid transferase (WecB/TagA/CpsF family)
MYPNPTKNVINIKADLSSRGKAILNILDSKGQVINSYTIFNNIELTLNLKHLPNALYLCQIVSNDGVSLHTEKLAIFR